MTRARAKRRLVIRRGSSAYAEGVKAARAAARAPTRKRAAGRPAETDFRFWRKHRDLLTFIAVFLDRDTERGAQKRALEAAAAKFGRDDTREIRRIWQRYSWVYSEHKADEAFLADPRNRELLEGLRKLK